MSALATECYEIASLIRFFCGVCTDEDFEICRAILKKGEFSTWAMIESDPGPLLPEPGQLVIYHENEELEPIEAIKVGNNNTIAGGCLIREEVGDNNFINHSDDCPRLVTKQKRK